MRHERGGGSSLVGQEHEGGREVDDVVSVRFELVVIEAFVFDEHALRQAVPVM